MRNLSTFLVQNIDAVCWAVLAVVLVIIEANTVQLVCIWFAISAFVTAIAACFSGVSLQTQLMLFLTVSIVTLLLTRRVVNKTLKVKKTPTNADRVIGKTATVTIEINNNEQSGRVQVDGLEWAARTLTQQVIPVHTLVEVLEIRGATLVVKPQE